MSQKSLIYAFVSRGTVILAEYTELSGNFNLLRSSASRSFRRPTTSSPTTAMAKGGREVITGKSNTSIFPPQKCNGCSHLVEKAILRIVALNQSSNTDIFLPSKEQLFLSQNLEKVCRFVRKSPITISVFFRKFFKIGNQISGMANHCADRC